MCKTKVMMFWVANLMVLVESSLYFVHLEITWECIACTCDAHVSWSWLVTRFSVTCGLLQIPVVHEIKQTWYTCGILFKYVIYLGYLSWAKVLSLCSGLIDPWYLRRIESYTWDTVMRWLCISLSVKPCGFNHFLINFAEPIKKNCFFCMHVLCISYAFLMHFLCNSYAVLKTPYTFSKTSYTFAQKYKVLKTA